MDKVTKKYLEKMLDGCDMGLSQIDQAIESVRNQLEEVQKQFDEMMEQKDEMITAQADLTKLLGVKKGPKAVVNDGTAIE